MYPSLVLSAAMLAPAAPIPRDTVPSTSGPAPRVLALKADSQGAVRIIGYTPVKMTVISTHFVIENINQNGKQIQRQVQKQVEQDIVTSQYTNKLLADFNGKFATADGSPLTLDEALSRVKNGATVLASADGKPIAKAWLRAVSPDTVVMVADGLSHLQPQMGSGHLPSTPAPRLAMLGTDERGKLMTTCTSAPQNTSGVYFDDVIELNGRGAAFRGRIARSYSVGQSQVDAKVIRKPLADVQFDAYDRTGKLVPRREVFKRLTAGGMVLVAGDNRLPDEAYTKAFREDVLILVGPDLVLPVQPIDQTKKKTPAKDGNNKAQPVAPVVPLAPVAPLPAVAPAVIRPAIKLNRVGGAVRPVPAQAVKPKAEAKPAEKPAEKK
jgi:hypothetical protein